MTHIIRQHYLHVEVNGTEPDALALQNRLTRLCQDWLLPALERAFDRCVPAHENWSIERLDIDAGILHLERLEQDLAERVGQAIEKSLLTQTPSGITPSPITLSGYSEQKTTLQNRDDVLVYFLKTGRLPWAFRLPEGKNLEQTLLAVWQEIIPSGLNTDSFLGVLAFRDARKRLLSQFSTLFLATLLERISPEGNKAMAGILQALRLSGAPPAEIRQFEKHLWETAFALIGTTNALTEHVIVGEAWRNLPVPMAQQPWLLNLLERHWPDLIQDSHSPLSATQKAAQRLDKPFSPKLPEKQSPNPTAVNESAKTRHPETAKPINTGAVTPEIREGVYIENAGLILLHPFLPRFFEGLGIAVEDKLIQPERALCLLHFLTTGQRIAPEYELILPKILCNLPLEAPVESDIGLTHSETEEAEALLGAVIQHWEALRNTSIDGLRGTFLLRFGKLSLRDDDDWLLQVEAKTVDILLSHLPWGISMIKLPWMQRMLWVEWSFS